VLIETLKLNKNAHETDSDDSDESYDEIRTYTAQCKCLIFVTVLGGSVAYGLPTLAVTRRTGQNVRKLKEIEEINKKLC
jgi:hypothetical protein